MILRVLSLPLLLLAACQPASNGDYGKAPPLAGARIGGPFTLVDQNGRTVSDASFAGRWRIMYFGYTFCPDVCPTDVQSIAAGLKAFEAANPALGAKVVPIFVTVDPDRDTPAVLRRFAAAFHPRLVALSGSTPAIEAVKKAYGVFSAKGETTPGGGYLVDHSRQSYLMDPADRPVALLPQDKGPDAVAEALSQWVH